VKIGKGSGQWHPHYHCLVMQPADGYVKDYDWLSKDWHDIVGHNGRDVVRKDGTPDKDWNGNVFIKKVDNRKKKDGKTGLLKAICETLKYILKADEAIFGKPDEPMEDLTLFSEAHRVLKGKRQTSTWGLLYGLAKEVEADMKEENDKKVKDFICQRCGCTEGTLMQILYETLSKDGTILYDIPRTRRKKSSSPPEDEPLSK